MVSVTEKAFLNSLTPLLAEAGFQYRKKDGLFEFGVDGVEQVCVSLFLTPTSKRGVKSLTVQLHVRLGPEEAVLESVGERLRFLININFGNLWHDPETGPALKVLDAEPQADAELIAEVIIAEVIPFMLECTRDKLIANLKCSNPLDRVTSDVNARFSLLLANAVLRADEGGFERLAEEFVGHCRTYLPYLVKDAEERVAALRKKLHEQGESLDEGIRPESPSCTAASGQRRDPACSEGIRPKGSGLRVPLAPQRPTRRSLASRPC